MEVLLHPILVSQDVRRKPGAGVNTLGLAGVNAIVYQDYGFSFLYVVSAGSNSPSPEIMNRCRGLPASVIPISFICASG